MTGKNPRPRYSENFKVVVKNFFAGHNRNQILLENFQQRSEKFQNFFEQEKAGKIGYFGLSTSQEPSVSKNDFRTANQTEDLPENTMISVTKENLVPCRRNLFANYKDRPLIESCVQYKPPDNRKF